MQNSRVRGSPLVRSILMTVALIAAAFGMMHVTRIREPQAAGPELIPAQSQKNLSMPYRLMLSDEAAEITLDPGNLKTQTGTLELDPANPNVFLTIRWKSEPIPGAHRFARLTLEPAGKASIVHVFDAPGDIDDVLELPLEQAAE